MYNQDVFSDQSLTVVSDHVAPRYRHELQKALVGRYREDDVAYVPVHANGCGFEENTTFARDVTRVGREGVGGKGRGQNRGRMSEGGRRRCEGVQGGAGQRDGRWFGWGGDETEGL